MCFSVTVVTNDLRENMETRHVNFATYLFDDIRLKDGRPFITTCTCVNALAMLQNAMVQFCFEPDTWSILYKAFRLLAKEFASEVR